ncbi:MAG: hypothetical protein K2N51_00685 [Lachnospiraceae bacterium]|nr:hypothetical protein [Lachnospiraceae bacterium]
MSVSTKIDVKNIVSILLEGASLGSFVFHTHFQLNFYCQVGKKIGEKEIPREVRLSILSDWWFGDKEEWDKTVKKMTKEFAFIEPEEPVLAFKLAALRWSEGSVIRSTKLSSEKLEIIFECGESITILNNDEEDCAWELHELNKENFDNCWSVLCGRGEYILIYAKMINMKVITIVM